MRDDDDGGDDDASVVICPICKRAHSIAVTKYYPETSKRYDGINVIHMTVREARVYPLRCRCRK